ncbi:hypothetical protein [Pukyongiella litopenaei]|uniref:Uncharacterized protein n=1 Tax=Pukyongiella litopenaei TaxID=2605946 RepID=A0A2S0MRA5_9RHOB|nr:hypothetical protein [Pukyongiella litopenaei]AVO38402.1 hypothetical protein C6Y53_12355 [Pukyongiella litopenaei]
MSPLVRLLAFPFRLIRRFAAFFAVLALVASLAFNVATLTVTGVYTAASTALNAIGISTVAARESGEKLARRKAARKIGRETAEKVSRRVQRGAVRNIASVGGEAIPVVGIAVIAGALALEVQDACDTAADMAGLEAALAAETDPDAARAEAIADFDCSAMIRELIPDYEDLPGQSEIWASMSDAPRAAYEKAREAGVSVAEVDWSGKAGELGGWIMGWMGYVGDYVTGEEEDPAQ